MGTGYRILRILRWKVLLRSRWETGEGPAKRVYSITPEGLMVRRVNKLHKGNER